MRLIIVTPLISRNLWKSVGWVGPWGGGDVLVGIDIWIFGSLLTASLVFFLISVIDNTNVTAVNCFD